MEGSREQVSILRSLRSIIYGPMCGKLCPNSTWLAVTPLALCSAPTISTSLEVIWSRSRPSTSPCTTLAFSSSALTFEIKCRIGTISSSRSDSRCLRLPCQLKYIRYHRFQNADCLLRVTLSASYMEATRWRKASAKISLSSSLPVRAAQKLCKI